jgi:diguanylate cyclase
VLIGHYSGWLVVVSLFVAIFASYTALDMAGRITACQTRHAACSWLGGGSFAMGLGIWSMHFIGMLAYNLPVSMG